MNHGFINEALVHAFGDWIIQEVPDGRIPYYINIMFDPLERPTHPCYHANDGCPLLGKRLVLRQTVQPI